MTKRYRQYFDRYSTQLLLVVVLLVFSLLMAWRSDFFITGKNIKNILEASTFRLILALGMNLVIVSGAIDLSAGSIVSLSGILMALSLRAELPVVLAVLIGICSGALLGAINGTLIHISGINSFIITLATSSVYRGSALILTRGNTISQFPSAFLFLGRSDVNKINPPLVIAVVLYIIAFPLVHRTKWGQYVQALGGNQEALRRSGVRCGIYRISAFILMGICAALTAVITIARLNSAEANAGIGMELDAITAVVMGGTLMSGGKLSLSGTGIAVLILGAIRNGLTIISVSSFYQQFIIGLILLASVLFSEIREKQKTLI
jgi:ribose/xylose/arabinose/galactoside ABC-type transport system permease subunit